MKDMVRIIAFEHPTVSGASAQIMLFVSLEWYDHVKKKKL